MLSSFFCCQSPVLWRESIWEHPGFGKCGTRTSPKCDIQCPVLDLVAEVEKNGTHKALFYKKIIFYYGCER